MLWTILGISVAVVAVFCVSVAELLVGHPLFENHRLHVAGALSAVGIVAWFAGRYLARKRGRIASDENAKVFVIFDLRYWGPMFVTLGAITLFIQTLTPVKSAAVVPVPVAVTKKKIVPVLELPVSNVHVRVVFPALKMQGVIVGRDSAVAIINGRSYSVGDHVADTTVTEIQRNSVTVEKDGETEMLFLAGAPVRSVEK